jgi:hypothetical protein
LAIYVLGLLLAFGWRSVVQWRRTGDTALRRDAGPPGSLGWWAKFAFVAALLLGLAGLAGLARSRCSTRLASGRRRGAAGPGDEVRLAIGRAAAPGS